MYLKNPKDINGQSALAVELTTTIYSGHAAGQERRTATARLVPLVESEDGGLVPMLEAANDIALTIDESTPANLIPHILMAQQGILGLVHEFGYDV